MDVGAELVLYLNSNQIWNNSVTDGISRLKKGVSRLIVLVTWEISQTRGDPSHLVVYFSYNMS